MAAGAPRQDQCVAEMAGSQLGETQVKKEEGRLRGPPRKAVEVSKVQDTQSVAGGGGPEHSDGSEGGRGRQVQCCFSSRLSRTLAEVSGEPHPWARRAVLACDLSDL